MSSANQNSLLAVLFINITVVGYVIHDALVKVATQTFSVFQIALFENAGILFLLLVVFLPLRGAAFLRTSRLGLQLLRAVFFLVSMFLFATALKHLLLADAVALVLVYPLIVTALSAAFLGEKVGPRRWAAVAVGFLGVLVIIRPGISIIHWASFLALAAAIMNALIQVTTRMLGSTEDNFTTMFYAALIGTLGSVAAVAMTSVIVGGEEVVTLQAKFVSTFWPEDPWFFVILAALTSTTFIIAFTIFRAYQLATASFLAPFTYADMVWAVIFGFFFFNEWPDVWTLVGAGILMAAGLYVVYRERVLDSQ
ncbi:DMT family transporter [Alphaproteobacteria bacterium]|jgi:drug/metabolite transporter (DMT)-like permease|nr:DMT family transporter [Alphaproteobacteria bacterium]